MDTPTEYHVDRALLSALQSSFPAEQLLHRPLDRIGYASDASFYRLIPQAVVQPKTEAEVQALLKLGHQQNTPVVFRAAGTSLSGQSVTDGVLVDVSRHWRKHEILAEGEYIRLQPGVVGGHANIYLKKFGRKIGPDPASLSTCMVGGIVANNASGMCCGVTANSYHTMESIRFILPSGHLYDTSVPEDYERFRRAESRLVEQISLLKDRIETRQILREKIRSKYQRKNTCGYSLNAFIDFEDPLDIFSHLLVGSEGTLGFISEVTFRTIPDPPRKGTAVIAFPALEAAVSAVWPFQKIGAEAVELMDRASLRSVEGQPGIPEDVGSVNPDAAALLVEFQAGDNETLRNQINRAEETLQGQAIEFSTGFSTDPRFQARMWKIRKGLYPSVGAVRKSGTSVIIEDIAFPLEHLAEATGKVRRLLDKHGYDEGIIFGHAKDGNLHFVITQEFNNVGLQQYQNLIDDIVDLVAIRYDGALKAEHGTGRNMAPFVEAEWGGTLYEIMKELKQAVDPENILNPGVIINDDPRSYITDIKHMPTVEPVVDKCVECGFCEPVCPSRDLTTTPRQRIVLWREITRLQQGSTQDRAMARELLSTYQFDAIDTCAADGLCQTACPVDIDTGKMMKLLRERHHSPLQQFLAEMTVRYFTTVAGGLRLLLGMAEQLQGIIGRDRWSALVGKFHLVTGGKLPAWNRYFPGPRRGTLYQTDPGHDKPDLVYFPSCLNRNLGDLPNEQSEMNTVQAFKTVLNRADMHYTFPRDVEALCCGTPWSSKGFSKAYKTMAERTTESLWDSSVGGEIPVVMDTSPCAFKMKHYDDILDGQHLEHWKQLTILDVIEYLDQEVLRRLTLTPLPGTVVCHPTCSTTKMEHTGHMRRIAVQCASHVHFPDHGDCCGFAGDRGLLHPELTASATKREAADVQRVPHVSGYYSTSRTCEVGMTSATNHTYRSIIHLVEQASREG